MTHPYQEPARSVAKRVEDLLSHDIEGRRIVEPGEFELQVGTSSADTRLRVPVNVTGTVHELGREWRMESSCAIER